MIYNIYTAERSKPICDEVIARSCWWGFSLLPSYRRQSEESLLFEYHEYGGNRLFRNISSKLPISTASSIRKTESSEGDIQTFDHLHTNRAGIEFHLEVLPQNCKKQLLASLFVCPIIRPSVRHHGTTRLPLDECLWIFMFHNFFFKSVETIHVSLKSYNSNGQFTWKHMYTYGNIFWILIMRNSSDKIVEEIKTHILFSITFFR